MNILLTGISGFIGNNLLKLIKNKFNDDKNNIIILSSNNIPDYININHNNYSFTKQDFFKKNIKNIDILIHLGAFIPKENAEANNIEKCISNITNTAYLLNNLPSIPQKIIFTSTIDVYKGTDDIDIISEDTLLGPDNLYAESKVFCEKILENWCLDNNVILQILRLGHIYGSGEDTYKKIIPTTIKKILNNEKPVIYTNGLEKRSFLNVYDCCRFILNAINIEKYVGPINIVAGQSISVIDIVNMIIKISGKSIEPDIKHNKIPVKNFVFNNSKMIKHIGVETIALEEGLKEEYEFFRNKQLFKHE
jgi:nucleoside-diphosphate-sugar epimerase